MTMFLFKLTTMAAWGICAAGMAYYCLQISRQITYVTLADGRRQERSLPLAFRLLLPLTPNLNAITHHPRWQRQRDRAAAQLTMAGFEGLLSSEEFIALRILSPVIYGTLWSLLMLFLARLDATIKEKLSLIILLGVGLFYMHPLIWLRHTIKQRHKEIQRALPFVIDLLTLSVEAGIDFMSGLQRVIERRRMDPLTEELLRMIHEIQLGASRRTALRSLSQRINMPDVRPSPFA